MLFRNLLRFNFKPSEGLEPSEGFPSSVPSERPLGRTQTKTQSSAVGALFVPPRPLGEGRVRVIMHLILITQITVQTAGMDTSLSS